MRSTRYDLLKGPKRRENNGLSRGAGHRRKRQRRAVTGQAPESTVARWMVVPLRAGSVFDEGRKSEAFPSGRKVICERASRNFGDELGSQSSHVNSPARRKAAKATHRAARRFVPCNHCPLHAVFGSECPE